MASKRHALEYRAGTAHGCRVAAASESSLLRDTQKSFDINLAELVFVLVFCIFGMSYFSCR